MSIFDKKFRLFLILALVIIIIFILNVKNFNDEIYKSFTVAKFLNTGQKINQQNQVKKGAYLSLKALSPAKERDAKESYEVSRNKDFKVEVIIKTEKAAIDGVDIALRYNPSILDAVNIETSSSSFNVLPLKNIDRQKGEIRFASLMPAGKSFQGEDKVASLVFRGLKESLTDISFIFKPSSTTDTNAAEHATGKDVLIRVKNIIIQVTK